MTRHTCPRCGLETRSACDTWPDRHPAAAVTAGLFVVTLTALMLSTHPLAAAAMAVLAGIGVRIYRVDRARRRREALAARADWEHRRLIAELARPAPPVRRPSRHPRSAPRAAPATPAPWHVVSLWPTTPLHPRRNRR